MRTFSVEFAIVWSRLVVKASSFPIRETHRSRRRQPTPRSGDRDRHSRQAAGFPGERLDQPEARDVPGLDEADRMLDMCFEPHTCKIVFQS